MASGRQDENQVNVELYRHDRWGDAGRGVREERRECLHVMAAASSEACSGSIGPASKARLDRDHAIRCGCYVINSKVIVEEGSWRGRDRR